MNPCLEESLLSLDCLRKYPHDKDACAVFTFNYKSCKEFWQRVIKERKSQGIEPELPSMQDRLNILKEHNANKSN